MAKKTEKLEAIEKIANGCFPVNEKTEKRYCDYIALASTLKRKYHPIVIGKNIFVYDGDKTGLYVKDPQLRVLKSFINELADSILLNFSLSKIRNEVLERLLNSKDCLYSDYPFDNSYAIGFRNGVVVFSPDGKSYELKPHSYKYKLLRSFDVDFNPEADRELFKNTLGKSWVAENKIEKLYWPLAVSILQSMPDAQAMKRVFFTIGRGNSGKSTYLELLEKLVGRDKVGRLTLHQICDKSNRFDRFVLLDKVINLGEEVSSKSLSDVTAFKAVTGSLHHDVEDKGKSKISAKICASLVFTTNKLPSLSEEIQNDDAFWRRVEIIEFANFFETNSSWSRDNLTDEIVQSFMVNVMDCVQKYWRGFPERTEDDLQDTRSTWVGYSTSPFAQFLNEMTENALGQYIPKDDLRYQYKMWATDPNVENYEEAELRKQANLSESVIGREAINNGLRQSKHAVQKKKGVPCYENICWKHGVTLYKRDDPQKTLDIVGDT